MDKIPAVIEFLEQCVDNEEEMELLCDILISEDDTQVTSSLLRFQEKWRVFIYNNGYPI